MVGPASIMPPTHGALAATFLRLGATSFGGSLLPLTEQAIVERRGWLSSEELLEGVALAELVPGPVAVKVAAWVGFRLRGALGGILAVAAFALPSVLCVALAGALLASVASASAAARLPGVALVAPVVTALFLATAWRLGRRGLRQRAHWLMALGALGAVRLGAAPIAVLLVAGLLNVLVAREPS